MFLVRGATSRDCSPKQDGTGLAVGTCMSHAGADVERRGGAAGASDEPARLRWIGILFVIPLVACQGVTSSEDGEGAAGDAAMRGPMQPSETDGGSTLDAGELGSAPDAETSADSASDAGAGGELEDDAGGAGAAPSPGADDVIIFRDDFEGGDLSGWDSVDSERYSVTSSPPHVRAGRNALQILFAPDDGYGAISKWFMPGFDDVFVRFYVMFESGFVNRRGDGYEMHFLGIHGNRIDDRTSASGQAGVRPNGTDFFNTTIQPGWIGRDHPTNMGPFELYSYFPDMTTTYGTYIGQSAPEVPLEPGRWQQVVFRVVANRPGRRDGSQTVWLDGEEKIDVQDMRWRDTTDLRVNQLIIYAYMPGGVKTQYAWIDDVVIWRPR